MRAQRGRNDRRPTWLLAWAEAIINATTRIAESGGRTRDEMKWRRVVLKHCYCAPGAGRRCAHVQTLRCVKTRVTITVSGPRGTGGDSACSAPLQLRITLRSVAAITRVPRNS